VPDGQGRLSYLVHQRSRVVRERLDEALLDDVLGSDWRDRPAETLIAETCRAMERWPETARAYESLARRDAKPARAWFRAGSSWRRAGEPERAIPALKRAWDMEPSGAESAYALAVAHATAGETAQGLDWLARALDSNLEEPERIEEDAGLAPLRGEPRFKTRVATVRTRPSA